MSLLVVVGLIWVVGFFALGITVMRIGYPRGDLRGELRPIGRILDKVTIAWFFGGALFLLLLERLS